MKCIVVSSDPPFPTPTAPGQSALYVIDVEESDGGRYRAGPLVTAGMIWPGPNIPAKVGTEWACIVIGKRIIPLIHQLPETVQCQ